MKRFSVLIVQLVMIACSLILPLLLLFSAYAGHMMTIARQESAKVAQSSLSHVQTILSMLAHTANAEATRIAATPQSIEDVANISDYNQIVQDIDVQVALSNVTGRLVTAQYADTRLRNIYLYALGSNYIITSDRGILRAETFEDFAWLSEYQAQAAKQNIARTALWNMRVIPAIDLIKNGAEDGRLPVISYLYGVTFPRNTKTRCVLVMNYYLSAISGLINEGVSQLGGTLILVDGQGRVISHPDLDMLGMDLSAEPYVQLALTDKGEAGFYLETPGRSPLLSLFGPSQAVYAYHKSTLNDWIIISTFTMQELVAQSGQATRLYLVYMLLAVGLGSSLCYFALWRLHRPVAQLAREIGPSQTRNVRNEYNLIHRAFVDLKTEEERLRTLIGRAQDDTRSLYLLSLCRGTRWDGPPPVDWPHGAFCVAVICLDRHQQVIKETTREERAYYRMLLIDRGQTVFGDRLFVQGTVIDTLTVALVTSTPYEAGETMLAVRTALEALQKSVRDEIPFSFSAGIGAQVHSQESLVTSYQRAQDALKQRLTYGAGSITGWHESLQQQGEYYYPVETEQKLLNCIAAMNADCAEDVVAGLPAELKDLPAENIVQVFNQIISAMVSQLLREGYPLHAIMGGVQNWYQMVSNAETLEELTALLGSLCGAVITSLRTENAQQDAHLPRILAYIAGHFQQDINFEAMAAEIGISYSYMRRIMREQRGKSLLDTVHGFRIDQAKALLADTQMPIKSIAETTGYKNPQSFERFFRKFEGISASEYRAIHADRR